MRRLLVPLVCLLIVVAALVGAARSSAVSVPLAASSHADHGRVSTPLFSARRVPSVAEQLAAGPELRLEMADVLRRSPPSTCAAVRMDGRFIYADDLDTPLVPASTEKLLTAFTALKVLGPDHRMVTKVVASAKPDAAGVVHGDVWLVGGGDPLLTTDAYRKTLPDPTQATALETLADRLVAAGVHQIDGRLLGDESRYDSQRFVPTWPSRYASDHETGPLSALTVNDGYASFPTPGPGARVPVKASPDPAKTAADALVLTLAARHVAVTGGAGTGPAAPGAVTLASLDSFPLSHIVGEMLANSDNQTAELVAKEIGRSAAPVGTTAGGVTVIRRTVADAGLPVTGTTQVDGSGLDLGNRVTCELLARLLDAAGPRSPLARGLAVAGKTGTLRGRLGSTAAVGRVRAKTGTLDDVTALAGFATTTRGQTLTFAIVGNGGPIQYAEVQAEDALAVDLVGYPGPFAPRAIWPRPPRDRG